MGIKKFLVVLMIFGLVRVCHAAPQLSISNRLQLPESQMMQVNIYPCLLCPILQAHTSSNCLAQSLQAGVGLQVLF
jgi:hypothetical protein